MAFQSLDAVTIGVALRSLPEAQRRAIELSYFGGLTHAEIAARLALPLGTVKGRMRLGLQKLAAHLGTLPVAPHRDAR